MSPTFATPDITKAQLVAVAQAIIGLAVAFGLDVSPHTRDAIIQLCTVIALVLPIADAVIRHGRSTGNANKL
jgi:multisubunit Na+/H+ antiporter MnhB subunit